jgi:hypothetical protein
MKRSTGIFQQRDLQERLQRLEREIARTKQAAAERGQRSRGDAAGQQTASPAPETPTAGTDEQR